jgi:hypothetical protein
MYNHHAKVVIEDFCTQVEIFMSLFFTDNICFNQFWCWLFGRQIRQATERTPSDKTSYFFGRAFSRKSKTYA